MARRHVIGWDIGGVNTKAAHVDGSGAVVSVLGKPFELQRTPNTLVSLLRELASEVGCPPGDDAAGQVVHAVTMTAELSQMFRTKREGVSFVLDAVAAAFPSSPAQVFTVDGRFVTASDARTHPLAVAAANWSATAHLVAIDHPDAVLIDIGTTTTDIIPIVAGRVVACGQTDPDRLASGELVYTGALRTPCEAIASEVVLGGKTVGVSADGFALAGDVHVWLGCLDPADYTVPTPDSRPPTKEFAGERLARVICADRELLDEQGITSIAHALAEAQVTRIASAIRRVVARHPGLNTAVVTGLGAFLADRAARTAGLRVVPLSQSLGDTAARFAPAAAVALLASQAAIGEPRVDLVVKIGGGLLAHPEALSDALAAVASASRERGVLVVPGGGPFADAVRQVDGQIQLSDDAAHWMAVLAMDQYAHLLAERLARSAIVTCPSELTAAISTARVPVLAPSRWLRDADPLPHSWDVTSDSIAAWVAGQLGARRLVLIKPPGAPATDLVDRYFSRALPAGVDSTIVAADERDSLRSALLS